MRFCALALGLTLATVTAASAQREITFRAGRIDTHADVHETSMGKAAPIILLFHQGGGDARGEYGPIIPRLVAQGFNVMAVDTRGGGTRFGGRNRAAATDSTFRYCEALAEVDGAVDAARKQGFSGPLVLWGSSYTAALVMQVALRRSTEVRAVLAFSPASGPPMAGCEPEGIAAELMRSGVHVLAVRARREMSVDLVIDQVNAFRTAGVPVYIAEAGAHGSSTLVPERVQGDVEPHWNRVQEFLRTALGSGSARFR